MSACKVDVDELADRIAERLAERMGVVSPMLSTARVGELLGLSDRTVRDMVSKGVLASVKVEGSRRIDAREVRRYLEERGSTAQEGKVQ